MRAAAAAVVLAAAPVAADRTCHAISSSVTDQWCNIGCNKVPPTCPANLCKCDGPAPSPPAPKSGKVFGAYFANWAQYHQAPYGPYTPTQLQGLLDKVDVLNYAFAKFDPSSFEVQQVEVKDQQFYEQIVSMKPPGMKFVLSVGGWNFDSAYFSKMASTKANRAAFISSAKSYLAANGFDGIDIDWEYPNSPARTDYVKYSCDKVTPHQDAGGAPDDAANLLLLLKELRSALGADAWISVASQAAKQNSGTWDLKSMSQYVDMFNVMTYDYSVSDLDTANLTAPNCPLNNPKGLSGDAASWSVSTTVDDYLAAGVPASKILVGIALYGHTWYTPGLSGKQWQKYGVPAMVQGECCGAFKTTYGAKYGSGSQLCGTLMISEIQAMSPQVVTDEQTQTRIGYTSDGVWISFDDETTAPLKAKLAKTKDLGGVFVFDTSMDTLSGSTHTYKVSTAVHDAL
eukprot:TRINITY_DN14277_c0_g1_i1.p1 TRINITY_DN14277_c0_g1~~TRINITY_DN14277_c0_g1_i1.p1  ORF type:complete len:457 (+),score=184.19 TRINITY_DN14277_c0_g1_i1:75-1445(+)